MAELFFAVTAVWVSMVAFTLRLITQKVPEYVMDELFHVPQTRHYCSLNFYHWDPKITTFPGTYIIAAAFGYMTSPFTSEPCPLYLLRACNVLLGIAVLRTVLCIQKRLWPHASPVDVSFMAVAICTLPTHFFFQFLYYTDVSGLLFVLLSFLSTLRRQPGVSAVHVAAAVLCRQTNVVWAAFIAGVAVLQEVASCKKPDDKEKAGAKAPPPLEEAVQVVVWMWQNKSRVLAVAGGHVAVILAFAVFLVVNGGIVVGDREAHQATLHLSQLPYYSLFVAAAFAPSWLPSSMLVQDFRAKALAVSGDLVFLSSVFAAMIANGTIAHPYLVADNRHYTFYIWKNILGRSALFRVALAPLYAACVYEVGCRFSRCFGWLYSAGFWVCVAAALLPAGLVEFRYFTVPAILFAVHVKPPVWYVSMLQIVCFASVNAATLYMFTERPFLWPDGTVARFMW